MGLRFFMMWGNMVDVQISTNLRDAVEARRAQLKMSPSDLIERSGLSSQAVLNVRRGMVRKYQDSLKIAITEALGWSTDSIDRLLAGDEPIVEFDPEPPVSPAESTDVAARFDSVDERLVEVREQLDELLGRAADVVVLLQKLAALQQSGVADGSQDPGHPSPTNNPNP